MRIAFFTDTFLPQINGIVSVLITTAEELGKRGHEVLILTPKAKGKATHPAWSVKNVRVVHLPSVPMMLYPEFRFSMLGMPKVLRELHAFCPDVIHFHTPLAVGLYAIQAAKIMGVPLVGTNHIYLTKDNSQFMQCVTKRPHIQRNLSKVVLALGKWFYDPCDVLISPSLHLKREHAQEGYQKMIDYLPNGIQTANIRRLSATEVEDVKREYGLRRKVVLHFGRLSLEKGVDVVLKSFAHVAKKRDDTSLLLIGDGPARRSLQKMAGELGIAESTVFTGAIPHADLLTSGIISVADIFVTASRMENHSIVLLEAIASGLPIVCIRDAGMREVVEGCGILVPPESAVRDIAVAVEEILTDEAHAQRLHEASLRRAEEFSVDRIIPRLVTLYRKAENRYRKRKNRSVLKKMTKMLNIT